MALIIGLAGAIATGKSTICRTIEEMGGVHCNGDTLVHQLYAPNTPGFDRVVAEFGSDVVGPDGVIDRKLLGAKVFGNPEAMRKLTTAMGDIAGLFKQTIEDYRANLGDEAVAIVEAVNLVEAGYGMWCDQVWVVAAEPDTMRARLMARNGFTEEEANQRITSQRDWRLRAPAADHVLHNDGTEVELEAAVRAEVERLLVLRRAGQLPASVYAAWREQAMAALRAQAAARPS